MEFNKERIKILFLSFLYFSLLSNTTYSQNDNLFGKDLDMKAQLTYNLKIFIRILTTRVLSNHRWFIQPMELMKTQLQ